MMYLSFLKSVTSENGWFCSDFAGEGREMSPSLQCEEQPKE